ncbi:hypothetical protein PHYBOEH_010160 [Phytophthora boehmeriae]|uniref:Cyclic nucleotide-binding domain-containing protein n=1 Tax=Phytophthora boehmeriae TaxID=109152 RepID=A0A8T1VS62_9STRA|nr:hypothetical protein PHYBOEH_010160 [Phytophthora boehmeriae]
MRLKRKTSAEEPMERFKAFDELHRSLVNAALDSSAGSDAHASYPSKNCCVRLLTILFSDTFATRFAETGNKPTRQQLDARETNANSSFWHDVTKDFKDNRSDYNNLHSDHTYVKAMASFTKSGEHGDDFFNFCDGALDVFYLRGCLELEHNLTQFVEGGMFDEDQLDSLKRGSSTITESVATSQKN